MTTELKRVYTVDQLEEMGALEDTFSYTFGHRWARDNEDEHRWYVVWRYVFEDTSDHTFWAINVCENKGDNGDLSWWYWYDNPEHIEAQRVVSTQVTVTKWVDADE